jgi:hypothetical protein
VYVPPLGAILFVLFAVPAAIVRSLAAIEGLLTGAGGLMLLVIGLATWHCAQTNARQDEGCTPPDLTGFLIVGSAMTITGSALTILAIVRSRRS